MSHTPHIWVASFARSEPVTGTNPACVQVTRQFLAGSPVFESLCVRETQWGGCCAAVHMGGCLQITYRVGWHAALAAGAAQHTIGAQHASCPLPPGACSHINVVEPNDVWIGREDCSAPQPGAAEQHESKGGQRHGGAQPCHVTTESEWVCAAHAGCEVWESPGLHAGRE